MFVFVLFNFMKSSTVYAAGLCTFVGFGSMIWPSIRFDIHTYIHKLYLSSDFSVAYIASISDPNLLILKVTTYII